MNLDPRKRASRPQKTHSWGLPAEGSLHVMPQKKLGGGEKDISKGYTGGKSCERSPKASEIKRKFRSEVFFAAL